MRKTYNIDQKHKDALDMRSGGHEVSDHIRQRWKTSARPPRMAHIVNSLYGGLIQILIVPILSISARISHKGGAAESDA